MKYFAINEDGIEVKRPGMELIWNAHSILLRKPAENFVTTCQLLLFPDIRTCWFLFDIVFLISQTIDLHLSSIGPNA